MHNPRSVQENIFHQTRPNGILTNSLQSTTPAKSPLPAAFAVTENYDLQHLIVFNNYYRGIFFGRLLQKGFNTGLAASIAAFHAQSYPQILCIRKQIAYAASS
jgi:hypothetical protein